MTDDPILDWVPPCPECKEALPEQYTIIAMRLYVCACGMENEVNARDQTVYYNAMKARMDMLEDRLRRYAPLALIDL